MNKIKISEDLLRIKDLIGKPKRNFSEEREIKSQLIELGHKIEEIDRKIEGKNNFDLKKIRGIIFLLKDRELTSSEVGKVLRISRNRANEYLRRMELDNILKSRFVGKKKYYTVYKND
ncbi:MAG: winged helix-turn-helix transcriptional regulator [Candidatus Aenigmarchaeota archaeon]|nr:winged helix-turn-helix transcriptional regulator [Candidatus Aenigmarchaeota archaeon]